MGDRILGSPNWVACKLTRMLLQLAYSFDNEVSQDEIEQHALTAIVLSTTLVEAFTNTYFRVVASDPKYASAGEVILKDLSGTLGTRAKLRKWTRLAFGKEIDTADDRWAKYDALVERRNGFIHFKSTHETVSLPSAGLPVVIHGLANLGAFAELNAATALECVRTAIGVVQLVGRCQEFSDSGNAAFVHQWLSIPAGHDLNKI